MCYLILPWLNDRSCCCVIRMSRVQVVESVSCKCFTDAELSTMNSQWFRSFCETRHGGSFVAPDVFPGQPYMDDSASAICEPQDEEANAMAEESPSGDNAHAANAEDSNMNMDCLVAVKVRTMHLSSRILASKSPFFYKLLYNSMRESKQRHVTLKIAASEEAPLMELLHFMCNNNSLNVTSPPALLDVLMVADKFDVASCVRYCSRVLRNIPMTCRKLKKVLTCNDFDHEVALMLVIRKLARFVRFPYVATASGTATTISRSLDAKMWMLRLQGTATGVGVKL